MKHFNVKSPMRVQILLSYYNRIIPITSALDTFDSTYKQDVSILRTSIPMSSMSRLSGFRSVTSYKLQATSIIIAVCIYRLVMISIDLSETAHFVHWNSEKMSETNCFSDKIFLRFFLRLDFVSDFDSDCIPQLYFLHNHFMLSCIDKLSIRHQNKWRHSDHIPTVYIWSHIILIIPQQLYCNVINTPIYLTRWASV